MTREPTERHGSGERQSPGPPPVVTRDPVDAELLDAFAALRMQDASTVPDIDALLQHRSRRRSALFRLSLPLAAAAALVVMFIRTGPDAEFRRAVLAYTTSPALGAWSSPTDFLLNTPGSDLLSGTPVIGRTSSWPAIPEAQAVSDDTTPGG